jgi:hypothetical protein
VTNTLVPVAHYQVHHHHQQNYVCNTYDNSFDIGDGVAIAAGAAILGGSDIAPSLDLPDTSTPATQPTTEPSTMPTDSNSDSTDPRGNSDNSNSTGADSSTGSVTSDPQRLL